jgi:hypothetical protein
MKAPPYVDELHFPLGPATGSLFAMRPPWGLPPEALAADNTAIQVRETGIEGWGQLVFMTDRLIVPNDQAELEEWAYTSGAGEGMLKRLASSPPAVRVRTRSGDTKWAYRFLYRVATGRYLLLSTHKSVPPAFLEEMNQRRSVTTPQVNVPALVSSLVVQPQRYVVSTLFARVKGHLRTARTLALWGEDVTRSALLHNLLDDLTPFRVTVRDVVRSTDVLSISQYGEVWFHFDGRESVLQAEECLRFIRQLQAMEWDSK